jgi:hypothetical protein
MRIYGHTLDLFETLVLIASRPLFITLLLRVYVYTHQGTFLHGEGVLAGDGQFRV